MRVVRTSVIICAIIVVFITVIVAASLVFYLRILDRIDVRNVQDDSEEWMDYDATSESALEAQTNPVKSVLDFEKLEEKISVPMLTDQTSDKDISRNATPVNLNFTQMAVNLGYECVEYEVATQDGYLLKIFRVKTSTDALPVLLVHGFSGSADTFILRGSNSLVGALCAAGRDVWIANFRGNKYSRKHLTLNPDTDKSFWDFSFHEHGVYDLPTVIDFVLKNSERSRLQVVSYSQGSTAFLAMSSTLPEYTNKVELVVLMSPICHLDNLQTVLPNFMFADTVVNIILSSLGKEEILGSYFHLAIFMKKLCSYGFIGSDWCLHGYLLKEDSDEVKLDFLPLLSAHYPAGTSMKNLRHMTQLYLRKSFSQYDFGFLKNMFVYGSRKPPRYDLSKSSMKVGLFVARNDKISLWKDVQVLKNELPNVAEYRVVHRKRFNHTDYVWGENVHKYLYPQVVEILHKYNK